MTYQVKLLYHEGDYLCKDKRERKKYPLSGRLFFLRKDHMSTHSKITVRSLFIWSNMLTIIGQNGVPQSRMKSGQLQSACLGCRVCFGVDCLWKVTSCHIQKSQFFGCTAVSLYFTTQEEFKQSMPQLKILQKSDRVCILEPDSIKYICLILWK